MIPSDSLRPAAFLLLHALILVPVCPQATPQNPPKGAIASSKESSGPSTTPSQKLLIKDGRPIKLKLKYGVYSQYAKIGDEVDYLVDEEVVVNGKIIVPEGAIVKGKVVSAEHKRRMGRGGKIDISADSVKLFNGQSIGSIAAASLPALLPSLNAQDESHDHDDGHRVFVFVSFSQAPAAGSVAMPRIGMQGAGTFDPDAGWVKGGGSFVLFDQAHPMPKPLIASGFWEPTAFVSYDTKGLPSYGTIQPAILTVLADVEGIGSGLTLELICNVGAVPLMTGQPEGWKLLDSPTYGSFVPLSPTITGITHLSVRGISIDCRAGDRKRE
jgi:hypothetical protein